MQHPALFLLDEDGEAYDVRRFCSTDCRSDYRSNHDGLFANGIDVDAIAETVCDQCETVIE